MTIIEYVQKWLGFLGLAVALFGICLAAKDLHLIIANFVKRMGGLGEAVFVRQARKIRGRYAKQEKHAATGGRITRWIANSSIRLERYYSKNLQRQVDNFLLGNGFPSGKITLEDGIASEVQVRQVMSRFRPSVDKFARSGEPIDFSTKALFWVIVGQILQIFAAIPLSLPSLS
ncbi:hypothetical protein [Ochrobactrum chromiisoli]|uniref:Uncharacterized protein n=1 Tax=Ochrobactrum chromiisoli TaxID=2993941 RepID=A0ABT3QUM8_9HYPH|nr:hypothetical protein [Ochrobactrum chromiisoli]MCX2699242.1 hypothetical protein [Ochrobactrum chromiisoli]